MAAGSRRIQRSVRVTVAVAVMVVAFAVVVLAVAVSALVALVAPAAVVGVGLGAVATRIMYSEVVQTRWEAACQRAEQARSFQSAMDRNHADHQAYTAVVARRIGERDRAIGELGGTVRRLERRIDEAETRVRRESRRANEAQQRLAAVLDEVLGTTDPDADPGANGGANGGADGGSGAAPGGILTEVLAARSDPPTVADLLAWDDRISSSTSSTSSSPRSARATTVA